ncbi:MAG: PAS domain-containing protein [Methanomicrobiales archaeon]|nr:PAS domain-containing protein [Methanomicrobiales archaeon]
MAGKKQKGKKAGSAESEARALMETEKPAMESKTPPRIIVGIGASAGGLEALEQFFSHLPDKSGIAFVVVTHQDPHREGLLAELVKRFTPMPVMVIQDRMPVQENTVYVIPPNADLSILHGTLTLMKPVLTKGLRLPIDLFFRHLADDQDGRAIGVILSGMGSDGTLGIRALKERAGMVMVQDPKSTKFNSMSESAIATGLVDYIAPAEDLPKILMEYIKHVSRFPPDQFVPSSAFDNSLSQIFILIRTRTGRDYSLYKHTTIRRRIARRMNVRLIARIEDYVQYLRENPQELDILAQDLLIGVTRFFRDPEAWDTLQKEVLPDLIRSKMGESVIRVWVVGCSTGEEAYSMAIVLHEALEAQQRSKDVRVQIFATDLDQGVIETARIGRYPSNIAMDVSPVRLDHFFSKEDDHYRIRQEVRETVIFAPQNVISDPPFTHMDILSCRNLLIYLSPELQKKLIPLFYIALDPDRILFLGTAETIGGYTDLFSVVDSKRKIFQRKDAAPRAEIQLELPAAFRSPAGRTTDVQTPATPARGVSMADITQKNLLEEYAPPAVLVRENGDVAYIHGRTGKYLEPSPGKGTMNINAMGREGLQYPLTIALRQAVKEKHEVTMEDVQVRMNGGHQRIRLTIRPVLRPRSAEDLFLVVFQDNPELAPQTPEKEGTEEGISAEPACEDLKRELIFTKAQLKSTIEEMQSSQEEMKSMNEELQSTNEELQSTNEEMITGKEELQSLNEELITVNTELQRKIDALSQSTDDMQNVIRNTEIPLLFLDNELRVRRFTEPISQIVRLAGSDIGRPISDFSINLKDQHLIKDVKEVLETLQLVKKQVETPEGKWFEVRILPYRTAENRIAGVAITFMDVTETKQLEIFLRDARTYAENIIATVREPLIVLDAELRVITANRSFYRTFQVTPEEAEGRLIYTIRNNQWDLPDLRRLLEAILPKNSEFENYRVEQDFPRLGHRIMLLNARRILTDAGSDLILLAMEDITPNPASETFSEQKQVER